MRLDKYLVEEDYYESRNRAHDAIKEGHITVDGEKPQASTKIDENSLVEVIDAKFYVSRAGRKLDSFLEEYSMDFSNKRALDIGSSTGGFAQIVLENNVASIVCVDVGTKQLHISLKNNKKLTLHEETDIRDFESPEKFELITCDVSFISILQILSDIDRLVKDEGDIVILYKPQFEVGKDVKRDNKGVVQDIDAIERRKEDFEAKAEKLGWQLKYKTASKVSGKEGNQEYLYHFVKIKIKK